MGHLPQEGHRERVFQIVAPLAVTLAQKPVSLENILCLVPGVMIQFEKGYDEPLTLEVAGRPFATGEAVKVGDKFGLRIRRLVDPQRESD